MDHLSELPFLIIAFFVAFTIHEFAHAYVAYKFGDDTAYRLGRVSLNPVKHIDWFGFALLIIAGFGWAKAVPVDRRNFKRPRLMSIVVSAAGPLSNLIIAFIAVFTIGMLDHFSAIDSLSQGAQEAVNLTLGYLLYINIVLFIFNLIPLPPLDGYRIVEDVAPRSFINTMRKYEHWGMFIFLIVVFIPPVKAVTIMPLFSLGDTIIEYMFKFVYLIF